MRILVDCTGINLNQRLLTGIPRVVQNYLLHGYDFAAAHGITVLPVVLHKGRMVMPPATPSFPHPPKGTPGLPRRKAKARAIRAAQGVAVAVGYVLYALPWLGFQVLRRMQRDAAAADAVTVACKRFGQHLLEPSDKLGRAYRNAMPLDSQPDDILFCPAYWHDVPPATYATLRGKVAHRAVLVHDIIPVTHPQYYHASWRDEFRANVAAALDGFDSVLTISDYTADMLRDCFPEAAARARIVVCRNGLERLRAEADPAPRHMAPFAGQAPFLMVGTIEPKKGHIAVLDALESLWDDGRVTRPLVVIGRRGWMYDAVTARLQGSRHPDKVIWLQDADDTALAYAYRHSHLMIHASEVEGFGLPMIESAAAGTPVLARRSAIAEEVLGAFGQYFDADEAQSLRTAILALEQPAHHAACRAALADFDWADWKHVVWALFAALRDQQGTGTPLPAEIWPRPAAALPVAVRRPA